MEFKAYIKNIKISPKKLRFFLPAIKELKPVEALNFLYYSPNKAAKILYKVVKSAIDNAKNISKVNEDLLKFKVLAVEEGPRLKRYLVGGRGTLKPIKKRLAHIKVILEAIINPNEKDEKGKKDVDKKNLSKIIEVKGLKMKQKSVKS